jgi:hypothetical protein
MSSTAVQEVGFERGWLLFTVLLAGDKRGRFSPFLVIRLH